MSENKYSYVLTPAELNELKRDKRISMESYPVKHFRIVPYRGIEHKVINMVFEIDDIKIDLLFSETQLQELLKEVQDHKFGQEIYFRGT